MVNDPFFFEIVRGVEDAATAKDYSLLIASQPQPAQEHRYLNLFRRGYVDAMVLTAADIQEHEVKQVIEQGVPVVLVQQYHKSIPSFGVDNYGGACMVARHLLGLGYRRIAYIAGTDYTIDNAERLRGLRDCLTEHDLTLPEVYVVRGDYRHGSGYDAMKLLLHLPAGPPGGGLRGERPDGARRDPGGQGLRHGRARRHCRRGVRRYFAGALRRSAIDDGRAAGLRAGSPGCDAGARNCQHATRRPQACT
jgi:hypothetical protein